MSLNLYEILQKVLNESVGSKEVSDVITNHNYVDITYVDEDSNAPGRRLIQPYAYGLSMADNEVLRAFQIEGDTLRGEPGWKTFRLDRITSWHPRRQSFNIPPPMQGYNVPDYNSEGDGSMKKVFIQAKFEGIDDTLGAERAKTQFVQNAPKLSMKNTQGPVPNASQQRKRNVFTSQPNSKKYAQYAKNIEDTDTQFNRFDDDIWAKAEAEADANQQQKIDTMLQNSARQPKKMQQGPISTPNKPKELNDEE